LKRGHSPPYSARAALTFLPSHRIYVNVNNIHTEKEGPSNERGCDP
jgi:hypothetical protein